MPGIRHYDDPCGVARALDLVGERWALLVVRELLLGPKRFTDLRAGLPAAGQNVLSQRLRGLEDAGVVHRRRLGPPASAWVYELTAHGRELEPTLFHLARWGSRTPMTSASPLGTDALMLALRTTFDANAAAGIEGVFTLRLDEDTFRATVATEGLTLDRGAAETPTGTVECSAETFRSLVFGGRRLSEATRDEGVRVTGDRRAVKRFLGLFPRPTPATSP
ncbi:transcriptional regulator [Amycolatopsis antarctica]|uniref:Transcriptional regulator n=1 Tax=Amycolatopsis antarctica TaxID=1854586 RepID=A0A263D3B6_9PSEU|nr:winged helix-turn-helix transcriptional regulator [Amycolatopsis antarctica]OZM71956.1 transcriptional regulator [Amycolatopsis antarctica]